MISVYGGGDYDEILLFYELGYEVEEISMSGGEKRR